MWLTLLNIVNVPILSPASIAEYIGGTRGDLTRASRAHHRPLPLFPLTLDITPATCPD